MAGFDKRDVAYTQARETLIRRIDDEGIARFDDQQRAGEIRKLVDELRADYPDLDDQLVKRLMGEGLRRGPDPAAGLDVAGDLPSTD